MSHLKPFEEREVLLLKPVQGRNWHLKRYAIIANGRSFDGDIAEAATEEAIARLPLAGDIGDATGNHGIGFQIIHFAETAVVSPVFYWQWGSVLARLVQIKAHWDNPTAFNEGVPEIVGCIWEMNIVQHEVNAWQATILGHTADPVNRLTTYLNTGLEL